MKRKDTAILLMIFSTIFSALETHYFGNNWLPVTLSEHICDGISLLAASFGLYLFITRNSYQ